MKNLRSPKSKKLVIMPGFTPLITIPDATAVHLGRNIQIDLRQ